MKTILTSLLLAVSMIANAASVNLAWDASPTLGVTNYALYVASSQAALGTTNAIRFNVGTNLAVTAVFTNTTTAYFAVSAVLFGIESDLSNTLIASIPKSPTNLLVVALNYTGTMNLPVTNNAAFLGLKIISTP